MSDSYGPNTTQIERFFAQLQSLSMTDLGHAVRVWREKSLDGWHAADDAVSAAISAARLERERDDVTERLYSIFRRAPWYTWDHPGSLVPGSEASAQYVASAALFALLVRDRIRPREFETLFRPFAGIIDVEEDGERRSPLRAPVEEREVPRQVAVETSETQNAAEPIEPPSQPEQPAALERGEGEIHREAGTSDGSDSAADNA